MTNAKCSQCVNLCKQLNFVVVVMCPLFEPRRSCQDLDRLLREVDTLTQRINTLGARTSQILAESGRTGKIQKAGEQDPG